MNMRTTNPGTARSKARRAALAVGACSLAILLAPVAHADDGGKSVYLLGKRGPLAAFVPKPGFYLSNDVYYYDASSSDLLPFGGDRLVQDVSAQALMDIPQFTWVTDVSVAGGRLAFSLLTPFGKLDVGWQGHGGLAERRPRPHASSIPTRTAGFARSGRGWLRRLEAPRRRQVPGLERVLVGVDPDRLLRSRAARQPEQQPLGARRRWRLHDGQLQGRP